MSTEVKSEKKAKDPVKQNQKIIDNHNKAAMHHEAAAKHLHEAAKHQKEGNKDMACGCNVKAKGETNAAKKAQKKNLKKHAQIA